MPLQNPGTIFVRRPSASLPRRHTGPGRPCMDVDRGYTDTGCGYRGGSLNGWTWSRGTSISRHSSCRTLAWRRSSAPKPQAINQRQSPRREILSSSSSPPVPIYLLTSFTNTRKNAAPDLQLLTSHLSVIGYTSRLGHGEIFKARYGRPVGCDMALT